MEISSLARAPRRLALALTLCSFAALPCLQAAAQSDNERPHPPTPQASEPSKPGPNPVAEKNPLPPLPPDAHVAQSITLDGKKLNYTATVGTLFVRDPQGKAVGQLVYTAYTVDGPNRPVTFAVNGGPGAASVYLNFGAIGPKHLNVGNEGDSPSDPATLVDNPGTWLDFTDLVFLDPIGTGFSRSLVDEDQTKKLFWSTEPDIEYLSRAIYDWLVVNDRLQSRKYLVGESYGGFRGPRITYYLQSQLGVAMNGVVLVSPYLNPTLEQNGDLSPLPWLVTLPSITAANLERQGKLTPEAMKGVIDYTLGDYLTTVVHGYTDQAGDRRDDQKGHRHDGPRSDLREAVRRAARNRRVSARGSSRAGQDRFGVRLQRDDVRPVPLCAGTARQRSAAGDPDRAHDHRDGGLGDAHRGLES